MDYQNNLRSLIISSLIWRYMERIGAQGVQFIVSLILARLLAPEVFITDHNHGMTPSSIDDYASQPLLVGSVVIEDNVWIGQRACILPGVTIGKFSIIGANSVVTKDIPPYSLAVGAPARVIKEWDKDRREWVPIEGEEGRRSPSGTRARR